MQKLEAGPSPVTATATKSTMFAGTQGKLLLLGVSKVPGLESKTAQVWNVHVYKKTVNHF